MKKLGRNAWILILLGLLGALLLLLGGLLGGRGEKEDADYADYLERRARRLCLSIDGVKEAEVFLTLERDVKTGGFSDSQTPNPAVRGVAVVCTNGDAPRVRKAVTELLSAALGIPSSRVRVEGSG